MAVVAEEVKTAEKKPDTFDLEPPLPPSLGNGGDGDEGIGDASWAFPVSKGQMGLWLLLTGVAMFFAGLSSAYIVLRGVPDWRNVAIPSLFWMNTFVLLASSVTMDLTRRRVREGQMAPTKFWVSATGILGLTFIVGQWVAWGQLVEAGVYLRTTLHSSFLYVITGAHALHLLGGVAAISYVLLQTFRNQYTASNHEPVLLCATYWHFMDGLWVYLFLLLILA